jgi:NADH-ubiquinone/plastoquinone oxidoreductase, chain 3
MNGILQNYLPLVVFVGVAAVIGLVLLIAPFLVAFQQPDAEKLSAYECGFNAFDDARMKFDVSGSGLSVSVGRGVRQAGSDRFLVDVRVPRRPYRRVCL